VIVLKNTLEKLYIKLIQLIEMRKKKKPLFFEEEKEDIKTTLGIKDDKWKPIELIRPRV
jgi:hypothetical protein